MFFLSATIFFNPYDVHKIYTHMDFLKYKILRNEKNKCLLLQKISDKLL